MAKGGVGCSLTFDFLGGTRVGIEDRSLPGDIEEDFDCHVCWRCGEVSGRNSDVMGRRRCERCERCA